MADVPLPPMARCGQGRINGMVWRPGDPVKHLGPPDHLGIRTGSRLFSTRCGLGLRYPGGELMGWMYATLTEDDDVWCPPCLAQAGIAHELYPDDE